MDTAFAHDGGKYFTSGKATKLGCPVPVGTVALPYVTIGHSETVASGVDANGVAVDRSLENQLHGCCKALLLGAVTLSAAAHCVITLRTQDSVDSTSGDFGDYTYRPSGNTQAAESLTVTDTGGGGTYPFTIEHDSDLVGAREFIRMVANATFSVPGTDTGWLAGAFLFTGGPSLPQGGPIAVVNA